MRDKLNCPNCGAAINGCVCQYCGTQFFDFADLDINKVNHLRIRVGDRILAVKAYLTNMETTYNYNSANPNMRIDIRFETISGTEREEK